MGFWLASIASGVAGTDSGGTSPALAATAALPAPAVSSASGASVTAPALAATATLAAPTVRPPYYSDAILAETALQSYWRLGESSGSSIADSKGSVTGTKGSAVTLGATGLVDGDANTAATFADDSTNAVVDLGNHYKFAGTANFSVEFLVDISDLTHTSHILGACDPHFSGGTYYNGWRIAINGHLIFDRNGNAVGALDRLVSTYTFVENTIYHVVCTYDGATMRLYVNGALADSLASTRSLTAAASNLFLGSPDVTMGSLEGALDEVAIYNAALSAAAVGAHYTALQGATPSSNPSVTAVPATATASMAAPSPLYIDATVTTDPLAATASMSIPGGLPAFAPATETDTAQVLSIGALYPITAATETDTAQALDSIAHRSITAATETDSAQILAFTSGAGHLTHTATADLLDTTTTADLIDSTTTGEILSRAPIPA